MSDVFISYSRKDSKFVRRLHDKLAELGRDVWVDWEDIPLTVDWMREIQSGIEAANTFAFVISPDSVRSDICHEEVDYASTHNKRLVPILYREIVADEDKSRMHPAISSHNWVMFRDQIDDFDVAFSGLLKAMDSDPIHVREHTRLLVRAKEWLDKNRESSLLLIGAEIDAAERWLSAGRNKDPHPTELHVQYIKTSRSVARSQRVRLVAGIVITGIIAALAVLAFLLAQDATTQRHEAEVYAANAATEAENARFAEATSVSDAATAIFAQGLADSNAQEASDQAGTAVAAQGTSDANASLAATQAANASRAAEESRSLVLAFNASEASPRNQIVGLSLAMEAQTQIDKPPLLVPRTLADLAYAPGPVKQISAVTGMDHTYALAAALSPDDTQALFSTPDGQLILMDIGDSPDTSQTRTIQANMASPVLAFSPDGSKVLVGEVSGQPTGDNAIAVLDLASDTLTTLVNIGPLFPRSIIYAPDGSLAYLNIYDPGAFGSAIWIIDPATGETVHKVNLPGQTEVTAIAVSSDGRNLAMGTADGRVYEADAQTGGIVSTVLDGADNTRVTTVLLTPDGSRLVVTWDDHALGVVDTSSYELLSMDDTGVQIFSGMVMANGDAAIYGTCTGQLTLQGTCSAGGVLEWNIKNASPILEMSGHTELVTAVGLDASGSPISASRDGTVIIWDEHNGALQGTVKAPGTWVTSIAYSPDGSQALVGAGDVIDDTSTNDIVLYDTSTWKPIRHFAGDTASVVQVVFSPDGTQALSASWDGQIALWDVATGQAIRRITVTESGVTAVAFSPDGHKALTGDYDGQMIEWNLDTGESLRTFDGYSDLTTRHTLPSQQDTGEQVKVVTAVAYSPDGHYAALGNGSGAVTVWNLDTGEMSRQLEGHESSVSSLVYSPDGDLLLSSSEDQTATLWNMATGTGNVLRGHNGPVYDAAFSPDGQIVATVSDDESIIIWDVATGERLRQYDVNRGSLLALAFSSDGHFLLVGGEGARNWHEGDLRYMTLWRVDTTKELVDWVRQHRVLHELSCQERRQYGALMPQECQAPTATPGG